MAVTFVGCMIDPFGPPSPLVPYAPSAEYQVCGADESMPFWNRRRVLRAGLVHRSASPVGWNHLRGQMWRLMEQITWSTIARSMQATAQRGTLHRHLNMTETNIPIPYGRVARIPRLIRTSRQTSQVPTQKDSFISKQAKKARSNLFSDQLRITSGHEGCATAIKVSNPAGDRGSIVPHDIYEYA
jgi:hypothetical protein